MIISTVSEMCLLDLVIVILDIHDCPGSIPAGKYQWILETFMLFGDNLFVIHSNVGTLFSGQKNPAPKKS